MSTTHRRSGASLRLLAALFVAPALSAQTADPSSGQPEFLGEQFETNPRARETPRVQPTRR
jgi:hypothetical protein